MSMATYSTGMFILHVLSMFLFALILMGLYVWEAARDNSWILANIVCRGSVSEPVAVFRASLLCILCIVLGFCGGTAILLLIFP